MAHIISTGSDVEAVCGSSRGERLGYCGRGDSTRFTLEPGWSATRGGLMSWGPVVSRARTHVVLVREEEGLTGVCYRCGERLSATEGRRHGEHANRNCGGRSTD